MSTEGSKWTQRLRGALCGWGLVVGVLREVCGLPCPVCMFVEKMGHPRDQRPDGNAQELRNDSEHGYCFPSVRCRPFPMWLEPFHQAGTVQPEVARGLWGPIQARCTRMRVHRCEYCSIFTLSGYICVPPNKNDPAWFGEGACP